MQKSVGLRHTTSEPASTKLLETHEKQPALGVGKLIAAIAGAIGVYTLVKRESRHMPVASPAASTVELIGQEFAAIPEVESVVISQHGDLVSVWTGVGSFDREIR